MTPQEAIKTLKREYLGDSEYMELAKQMGAKALEKQIPKKPLENRYPWCVCPACAGSVYVEKVQEHIQNNENTYCEHCGQALDWSDTE